MADGAAAGHGGKDRLNGLHDDLLHQIIAHLPFTDAARTSVLAARWRQLWRSTPLAIDDGHLPVPARATSAVARFLEEHPGPFRTVRLRHCRFASLDPTWPRLLAGKGTLQELALHNKVGKVQPYPARLPAEILRCASLRCLSLALWEFPGDLSGGADIILPQLRVLELINIYISKEDLDTLLAFSPVLETLTVRGPWAFRSGAFWNYHKGKRFHLRSQSLRSVVLGLSGVEQFEVTDAPVLESLILKEQSAAGGDDGGRISIAFAPNLRVLGYLEPRVHTLQIAGNVIRSDTVASPSVVVPGLKILALRVNFRVLREVKMLASFLRCFPNIDTLHIESALHDPSAIHYGVTREQHAELWQEASALKCSISHLKRMVFHKFRGHQNEFEFLKFIATDAHQLESLLLVPLKGSFASSIEVNEIIDKLECPQFRAWASEVLIVSPKMDIARNLQKASNLSINDPFCY
ncbi:F-box/FBD/LRR-repeat protein At1g51370 [Lolium perenne]|uniref:F-box/FBD/LRR-repeat protein At1g51370 n=1 Tax=Lolium perenne TaxID=4522 RepID=UPI0021EABF12|nr:F-box/FBD/LRR-repeat protein At1g51370-like [Lolium perenne]